MAQFGDFLGRLFSTGDSRGLSGDVDLVLPSGPELAFYNEGLARHRTDGDLVSDPEQLWEPTGRKRKGGLAAHLLTRNSEGVINFTDVLIIISKADWARAEKGASPMWADKAARMLLGRFQEFCEAEDLHLIFPQRPMQFQLIQDGGPRMEGEDLGLQEGEFITGLLPNQHGRPSSLSRALIAVHLNLPGTWEGYYEVGRLYNDQALFTLGNHWLDNFSHPALPRPALYRLQQQEDGSFVHIIDPEVSELFEISSQGPEEGPSVLTIQSINGNPIAHLVLEVITDVTADPEALTRALPPSEVPTANPSGQHRPLSEGVTAIYNQPVGQQGSPINVSATKTIIPDVVCERILTLRERGALLQKVHFSRFMLGYDVYIGRSGEVGTAISDPVATIQVRRRQINILAHFPSINLNGIPIPPGTPMPMEGDNEIDLGEQCIQFSDLRGVAADGWPYVGEIRRGGNNIHLLFGKGHQLGRARNCQVTLPDKPHNENIVWRTEVGEGATIRVRTGEIPKAQFYTDSIMVASLHAEIDLSGEPMLVNRARHCHTFVRRRQDVFSLYPIKDQSGPTSLDLQAGDQLLIGNSVFEVDYPPVAQMRSAYGTDDMLSPDVLAAAIDTPVHTPPPFVDSDLPAAAGLGERGSRPPALELGSIGNDSIFDMPAAKAGITLPRVDPVSEPPPERISAPMMIDSIDESIERPALNVPLTARTLPVPEVTPVPELKPVTALDAPSLSDVTAPPPSTDSAEVGSDVDMSQLGVEAEQENAHHDDLRNDVVQPPLPAEDASMPAALPPPLPIDPVPPLGFFEVEPEAITSPDMPEDTPDNVVVVDESQCQFELSRPARLVLVGWMVSGEITIGNHRDAAAIIPENRSEPDQVFIPQDYFSLFVRGRRVRARRTALGEARLVSGDQAVDETTEGDGMLMEVVRRDPDGEPDFFVALSLSAELRLPDPRAQLLQVDQDDPMVESLFTIGLPLKNARTFTLGALKLTALFDGSRMTITDYLSSYQQADGSWHPFFIRSGAGRFHTAPEDGSPITLAPGDQLLMGTAIYRFEEG